MRYKKVAFNQVKKEIKKNGMFKGFAVGSDVAETNFFNGWRLAVKCELADMQQAEQFKTRMKIQAENNYRSARISWYEFTDK